MTRLMCVLTALLSPVCLLAQRGGVEPLYYEYQVNKPARHAPNSRGPEYPPQLKARQVEGTVLVQYVVDTLGRVEPKTIKILRTPDSAFSAAVTIALPKMRFSPAERSGKRVRQLVQEPVQFVVPPLE